MAEYKRKIMGGEINADTFILLTLSEKKEKDGICYQGCSNINPHLANICDMFRDYFLKCPTYNFRLNGGNS